jgi:predicted kinase
MFVRQPTRQVQLSSDDIAVEMFGPAVDREVADPEIFAERDRRLAQRLVAGRTAVVDATNVLPQARARVAAIARRFGAAVVVLRFGQPPGVLLAQNVERDERLPARQVRDYAVLQLGSAADASRVVPIVEVPVRTGRATTTADPVPGVVRRCPAAGRLPGLFLPSHGPLAVLSCGYPPRVVQMRIFTGGRDHGSGVTLGLTRRGISACGASTRSAVAVSPVQFGGGPMREGVSQPRDQRRHRYPPRLSRPCRAAPA